MQKRGTQAKMLTAEEFEDKMIKEVKPKIEALVRSHKREFPNGMASVLLMMDGAAWHTAAVKEGLLGKMGIPPGNLLAHPPNSPDFQAPVEWANAALGASLTEYLKRHPAISTPAGYKRAARENFDGKLLYRKPVLTAAGVKRAFDAMFTNMEAVRAADGGWGQRNYT
jgi:hypothetical protein